MEALETRPFPFEDEEIRAVAVEPRRPHRCAVASDDYIVLFDFASDDKGYRHLRRDPTVAAKHKQLAWGLVNGRCVLHVLGDEGAVQRETPGQPSEEIPLENVVALANDANGMLAFVTNNDETPTLYASDDGENWLFRQLPTTIADDTSVHLAILGMTAAVSVDGELWISRGKDDPFASDESVASAGAIALGNDGAIYVYDDQVAAVVRVDESGDATPVKEMQSRVASLAWDESRKTLWAASRDALVMMGRPSTALLS